MTDKTAEQRVPYINDAFELIIPTGSDPRYHHWKGGQKLAVTLAELDAPREVWTTYLGKDKDIRSEEDPNNCRRCNKPLEWACQQTLLYCPRCNRYRDERPSEH